MVIALTGDRPTGKLHLGHYVGSIGKRLEYQCRTDSVLFIMIADVQALTDYYAQPGYVAQSVLEIMCDYLAVGLNPEKVTFFVQSGVPELAELTVYFMNLVTVSRLERNPTVKAEIQQKLFGDSVPAGFLCYPISQAADIAAFRAEHVLVGADQAPMIEQTNEIVRRFNKLYAVDCLKETKAVFGKVARLMGVDGGCKASKSSGNAIFLSDDADTIKSKVRSMYTDQGHLFIDSPGKVEGNVVFQYLDAFYDDVEDLADLKKRYTRGGLGDMEIKGLLNDVLQKFIAPIRERRMSVMTDLKGVLEILHDGTRKARVVAKETLCDVRKAIGLDY